MNSTKLKIFEVIVENREQEFDNIRVALLQASEELKFGRRMSWEEIASNIWQLHREKFVAVLAGDDEILELFIQPTALSRLTEIYENEQDEKVKRIIDRIFNLF